MIIASLIVGLSNSGKAIFNISSFIITWARIMAYVKKVGVERRMGVGML